MEEEAVPAVVEEEPVSVEAAAAVPVEEVPAVPVVATTVLIVELPLEEGVGRRRKKKQEVIPPLSPRITRIRRLRKL